MSSKNVPRRKNSGSPAWPWRLASLLFAVALCCAVSSAADKVKDLQARFDHESHATGKIKELQKLAPAQFETATTAGNAGDYVTVAFIFEKYRDNIRQAFELLRKQEPDVDRHSNGYRHLELEIRQGIREVEDTLLVVPENVRPPLQIVRQDLVETDDALINLLFPRRTKEPVKVPPPPEAKP